MTRSTALALLAACAACATATAPPPSAAPAPGRPPARHRMEEAPAELQPALARADAAMRTLREQIAVRLWGEVAAAGVSRAISVCQRDAGAIAAAVSAQTGVDVGRLGVRPRPGATLPRAWIGPVLEEISAKRAADVPPVVLDLGDRVGVLRPIALAAPCLSCHGAPDRVLPEVKHASDAAYAGFAEGDLRGFFWAEARK